MDQLFPRPLWLAAAVLVLVSASATFLVLLRVVLTWKAKFLFLPGNLVLAWLPFLFALQLHRWEAKGRAWRWYFLGVFVLWFFFLPNAPYIITDLIHLRPRPPVPIWVDMMLIVLFAWIGMVLGFLSLYVVQSIIARHWGPMRGWGFALTVLALVGVGIYLGRFLRWNSWDIVHSPHAILLDTWRHFGDPRGEPAPFVYSFLFAQVFGCGYVMLYALTHLRLPLHRQAVAP